MIAALFVESGGVYDELEGVDAWDVERDARKYDGPHAVVAHPPCAAFCKFAGLREYVHGLPAGEDDGCFEAALLAVRTWGGVLEHPAFSKAWATYDLPFPLRGGWARSLFDNGWATEISQRAYGHLARKPTWLYYVGPPPPPLDWATPDAAGSCGRTGFGDDDPLPEISKRERKATPLPFRDLLLELARSSSRAAP